MAFYEQAWLHLPDSVVDHEAGRKGPKRKVPFEALLVGAVYHVLFRNPSSLHMSAIAQDIELFPSKRKKELGVRGNATSKNVWQTKASFLGLLTKLTVEGEPWVNQQTGEILEGGPMGGNSTSSLDVFINWMIAALLPEGLASPEGTATDGTGVEAFAIYHRPHRGQRTSVGVDPTTDMNTTVSQDDSGHGQRGPADPDARWGKKTATDNHPKEMYFGYEAHFGVDAYPQGTVDAPRVLRSFMLVPAGSSRAAAGLAGLDIIKKVAAEGYRLSRVYVDRGYSMLKAENWQLPLWNRNLCSVFDLAQNQRGARPSVHQGTIFIDGALFTQAVPEKYRNLLSPTETGISSDEKAKRARLFDERSTYAYRPHGARNPETGRQRFKGPATAGKLRCPNNGLSMRLDYKYPETSCATDTPERKCGCSGTVTIGPEQYARESQWPLFGTTAWKKLYGARNAVESFNAEVRTNKLGWRRGYVKTFNRPRTAFLLAISLAALNFWIVRDWSFRRRTQSPWAGETWDFGPEPKKTRAPRTKPITDKPAT